MKSYEQSNLSLFEIYTLAETSTMKLIQELCHLPNGKFEERAEEVLNLCSEGIDLNPEYAPFYYMRAFAALRDSFDNILDDKAAEDYKKAYALDAEKVAALDAIYELNLHMGVDHAED